MTDKKKLGEILLEYRIITEEQLQEALSFNRKDGQRIGDVLKALHFVTQEEINWVVTKQFGIPYLTVPDDSIDMQIMRSFPFSVLEEMNAFPVFLEDGVFHFAVSDPTDDVCLARIRELTSGRYKLCLAESSRIRHLLNAVYPYLPFSVKPRSVLTDDAHPRLLYGFHHENAPMDLAVLALNHLNSELICLHDKGMIQLYSVDQNQQTHLFEMQDVSGWQHLCDGLRCKPENDHYYHDNQYLYRVRFIPGTWKNRCAFSVFATQEDLVPIPQLEAFEKMILSASMIPDQQFWHLDLPFFSGLACFYIVWKNLFSEKIVMHDLDHLLPEIPFLYQEAGRSSQQRRKIPILTDQVTNAKESLLSGRNCFYIGALAEQDIPSGIQILRISLDPFGNLTMEVES